MTPTEIQEVQKAIVEGISACGSFGLPVKADAPPVVPAVKPAWKTTEFWGHVAVSLISLVVAGGVIPSTGPWAQMIALLTFGLSQAGYSVSRGLCKMNAPTK